MGPTAPTRATGRPGRLDGLTAAPDNDMAGSSYAEFYVEYAPAARRLALSMVPRDVADDIVAEAFTRVLGAIRAGGGPDIAFRGYLLAAVRNLAADWLRAGRRVEVAGDLDIEDREAGRNELLASLISGPEAQAEARAEARLVARAFHRLPVRWRAVLWQLEVEGKAPMAVAPMFGLSANGVSALAMRAREGLRQAYLQEHVGANIPPSCRSHAALLGAGARGRLSRRRWLTMHEHLQHCAACSDLFAELTELSNRLGSLLPPAVLAGASAAMATGRRIVLNRAWHTGPWHLWRVHPVTAVTGAAAGMAAAGSMVLAVSLAPVMGSPAQHVAARPAASPVSLTASGPAARGQRAGGTGRSPGKAAPLSGTASPGGTAGTACTRAGGTVSGMCGDAGSPAPAGVMAGAAGQAPQNGETVIGPSGRPPGKIRMALAAVISGLGRVVTNAGQTLGSVLGAITESLGNQAGVTTKGLGSVLDATTGSLGNQAGSITSNRGSMMGPGRSGTGNIIGNGTSKLRTEPGNVIPIAGRTDEVPRSSRLFPG
jgi:RNA polymerase sigma factor (sigma-70 family)